MGQRSHAAREGRARAGARHAVLHVLRQQSWRPGGARRGWRQARDRRGGLAPECGRRGLRRLVCGVPRQLSGGAGRLSGAAHEHARGDARPGHDEGRLGAAGGGREGARGHALHGRRKQFPSDVDACRRSSGDPAPLRDADGQAGRAGRALRQRGVGIRLSHGAGAAGGAHCAGDGLQNEAALNRVRTGRVRVAWGLCYNARLVVIHGKSATVTTTARPFFRDRLFVLKEKQNVRSRYQEVRHRRAIRAWHR
ncbi:hypothetical protein PSAC2689_20570 [Paraburkholderia sacchari]